MARVRSGVVTKIDRVSKIMQAVRALTTHQIMVGVPQDKDSRRGDGELGNAEIGYLMENGVPEQNVPARPHLVPGVRDARPRVNEYLRQAARLAVEGKPEAVLRAYAAAGLAAQSAIKARIRNVIPPPLAPATLAARRARGRKGTTPLLDTAQYMNSITFVVRKVR